MKVYLRLLALVAFAVCSLLLIFYFTRSTREKPSPQSIAQNQAVNTVIPGLPMRLTIPKLNIDADIQYVGVNPKGEMEVPSNTDDVGWFNLGSRPGEKGSAVISGHIDGESGDSGVFADLHKLKDGDKLYIEDDSGKTTSFVVRDRRIYNPGYAEEVFSLNDSAHLNLITCDGVWDGAKKSYTKRLVVFADITH